MKKTMAKSAWFVRNVMFFTLIAVLAIALTACDNGTGTPPVAGGGGFVPEYAIGDTGPGGGIVFYDKGSVSDGWRYLEAAPVFQGTSFIWCNCAYPLGCNITGAMGTAIGTCKANTAAIVAAHSGDTASNNAAKAAATYTGGGKNDWFLPSKDELNEMYKARTHLGIISSAKLWSSSQYDIVNAWGQYFVNGNQSYFTKGFNYNFEHVLAIRAF